MLLTLPEIEKITGVSRGVFRYYIEKNTIKTLGGSPARITDKNAFTVLNIIGSKEGSDKLKAYIHDSVTI